MRLKRLDSRRLLATLVVLVALVGGTAVGSDEPSADARQRVVLPAAGRHKILAEMRHMLGSVSGVVHGLAANDMAVAERAARASGMTGAADVDPGIKARLPREFLQLAMQTHQGFDRVADQIKAGGGRVAILKDLASLTGNCVVCHETYRLEEAR